MKPISSPIRKLCLAIATVGVLAVNQGSWACEKPQIKGYDDVGCLSEEGLALVEKNGKYGYIDKNGKEVIALQYDGVLSFSEGLVLVVKNDKYGFIDKTGKVVVPLQYDWVEKDFSNGRIFAEVERNGDTYYVSKLGDEYTWVGSVSEGLAKVKKNGKYGFIDKNGKVVIPLQYDGAWSFSEGLALVVKNDKYSFIDKNGKMVIVNLSYDDTNSFSEGLAWVKKNDKYGFIDKTGKEVIALQYDYAYSFSEGLARVEKNGEEFYIDKKGNRVD